MTPSEKNFLRVMTDAFKNLTMELVSYKEAIEIFRETHPSETQLIDAARIDVLNSPALRDSVHLKFDVALEKFYSEDHETLSGSDLLALLQAILQKQRPN